jgi:hypothetical protein
MAEQPPRPPDGDPSLGAGSGEPPPPPSTPPASPTPTPPGWAAPQYQVPAPTGTDPAAYVRAHAGRYTREALTARLAAAGHTPEAIASAWATVEAEDAAEGRRDRRGTVSKVIGGAYVGTWLVLTLLWLASNTGQAGSIALVSGVFAFFLLVPGILGYVLPRQSRRLRRAGIGTAVAFALVPLLILVALTGICVAIVPPSGFQ